MARRKRRSVERADSICAVSVSEGWISKKLAKGLIAIGLGKPDPQRNNAPIRQRRKEPELDLALKDPAGHHQRLDDSIGSQQAHQDFAVAASAIVQRRGEEPASRLQERLDLLIQPAPAVRVELVGLVDELNRAGSIAARPILERQPHPEAGQESGQVRPLSIGRGDPCRSAPVQRGSLVVLFGNRRLGEPGRQQVQELGKAIISSWKGQGGHLGKGGPDFGELDRVVIHVYERIESQIELGGERAKLGRLGVIAREDSDEVLLL